MRWLWVSRLAYDTVASERDRLREQNDKLFDHLQRMDRLEHHTTETPREPAKPREDIPRELFDTFRGYADRKIATRLEAEARERHRRGESWDTIKPDYVIPKDDNP